MTRKQLFLGLFTPKRTIEHATSHNRHPEHRSGTTVSRRLIAALLLCCETADGLVFSSDFPIFHSQQIPSCSPKRTNIDRMLSHRPLT